MKFPKNVNNKRCAPKIEFFKEKKFRKIRIIFDIENWLWKSEIRIFQPPPAKRILICQKNFFYGKVLFSTQLSCHLMRKLLKKSWMVSSVQSRTDIRLTHFNGFSPACVVDCLKCVSKTSSEEALIPGFSCKHIVFKLSNDHNFGCHLLYFELSSSHQGSM